MLFIINSRDRVQGTSDNFKYQLTVGIEKVKKYRVSKVSIPFTYYNIRTQDLMINGDIYTIAEGNYSPQSFVSYWNSVINPLLTTAINIVYDPVRNKYNFTSLGNMTFDFTISDVPRAYSLSKAFGLNNFGPVLSQESGVLNFTATSNLYLQSNELTLVPSYFNRRKSNIFQSVAVDVNPYNWIVQKNILEMMYPWDENITTFNIQLIDDDNNQVLLNGSDMIIELQLYF